MPRTVVSPESVLGLLVRDLLPVHADTAPSERMSIGSAVRACVGQSLVCPCGKVWLNSAGGCLLVAKSANARAQTLGPSPGMPARQITQLWHGVLLQMTWLAGCLHSWVFTA